ncbi:MAG: small multi-drug export protein [Campylobacterota bacterium]|nr:small multi-drug export protein [Campylobacterota bacterium]
MFKIKEFISKPEGKIFLAGVLLLIVYILNIINLYLFSVKDANNLVGMTVANFLFGRAAGISYGYTAEFNDLAIVLMNMAVEFIMVMIIYPLFVLSWNSSVDIKFLKDMSENIETQRVKYKEFFQKYGKYGLFIFVWFPFWMTGPVVGSIIGYLIGIRHYTTMLIVLMGTSLAIVVWTYFLRELIGILNQASSYATYILLALFIVVAIVLKFRKKNTPN